jgi:TonB family protein
MHSALEELILQERLATGTVPLGQYMERLFARERESQGSGLLPLLAEDTSPRYSGERGTVAARPPLTRARQRYLVRRWLQVGAVGVAALGVGLLAWRWQRPLPAGTSAERAGAAAAADAPLAASVMEGAMEASQLTGRGDEPPQLLVGPLPKVPTQALPLSPTIVCRLLIDTHGAVVKASVFRSRLDLTEYEDAALAAVQRWQFKPALRAGRPVAAWINWPVRFAD